MPSLPAAATATIVAVQLICQPWQAAAFASPSANFVHRTFSSSSSSRTKKDQSLSTSFVLQAVHHDGKKNEHNSHHHRRLDDDDDDDTFFEPLTSFARPLVTAATSAILASSLLFPTNPLFPPPQAHAASSLSSSPTATSIDIDLKGLPALTRKAIINRDALSQYLIQSAKSFEPILRTLSESDTVTIRPPKDVKAAIKSLAGGEAQFVVNGDNLVDVRVESVPGVVVVRIINPNLPRLPFLKDGTAALKFLDEIVDAAPDEFEKAAEEVKAFENFLSWGAPTKAPLRFKGSSLDYFLNSKFVYGEDQRAVSLGVLGDLTNSEVIVGVIAGGMVGVYGASYGYYIKLREDAEREAAEKKVSAAAAKKAKAAAAAAAKKAVEANKEQPALEAKKVEPKPAPVEVVKVEEPTKEILSNDDVPAPVVEQNVDESTSTISSSSSSKAGSDVVPQPKPKMRKRDAIKKLFGRGD